MRDEYRQPERRNANHNQQHIANRRQPHGSQQNAPRHRNAQGRTQNRHNRFQQNTNQRTRRQPQSPFGINATIFNRLAVDLMRGRIAEHRLQQQSTRKPATPNARTPSQKRRQRRINHQQYRARAINQFAKVNVPIEKEKANSSAPNTENDSRNAIKRQPSIEPARKSETNWGDISPDYE